MTPHTTDLSREKAIDRILGVEEAVSLEDLQKFLAEEIGTPGSEGDFSRAFTAMTDGLGLESPVPASSATASQRPSRLDALFEGGPAEPGRPTVAQEERGLKDPPAKPSPSRPVEEETILPTEKLAARRLIAQAMETPQVVEEKVVAEPVPRAAAAVPPPMPMPGSLRRLGAAVLDEVFVLTLWLGALALTAYALTGTVNFSSTFFKEFSKPLFIRYAALEFASLWLAYLAVSIGLVDRTFGMWVWGILIGYPGARGDSRFIRKCLRVLFSFLFFAPVAPLVLLMLRWKGRNLLDRLSGTGLYLAAS